MGISRHHSDITEVHRFTLVLTGISEVSTEIEDALFEAGCDDALLWTRDGVAYLDFDREAASYQEAVQSAIADVQAAGIGVPEPKLADETE